jgi:hypothetical protein
MNDVAEEIDAVTEVIGRSTQGITRPFLCRGDDGWLYYVKGNGAGRTSLIGEWIAGHLGTRLGLPIPDFKQALIPKELVQFSARDDIADLGAGTGFASQKIENADELTYLFIEQIDTALRAKILLLDWWTANGDRTLTEHGGNPNILWVHSDHKPYVIDHNNAFDETALADFWSQHIFASTRLAWTSPFRHAVEPLMKAALTNLDQWWKDMPPEWTDDYTRLNLQQVQTLLWRFETNPAIFWGAA